MIGKITIDYDAERVYPFDHNGVLIPVHEGRPPESTSFSFEELPGFVFPFYFKVIRARLEDAITGKQ